MLSNSVNRSKAVEHTLQVLGGKDAILFTTLRDALSFAATLGYKESRRMALDPSVGKEDIQASVYQMHEAVDLIFAMALAVNKSIDILKLENEKECIQIFEEYANGGLHLIAEWLELYADIDVEDAIWRGLKTIDFIPKSEGLNSNTFNAPTF